MKKILLLAVVLGGAWWHFNGGTDLSDELVDEFYAQQMAATLSRDPETLCNQLASDYSGSNVTITLAGRMKEEPNKEQACKGLHEMYEGFEKLGESMGGIVQLDYDQQIHKVTIFSNKKSAIVETTFKFNVAGSLIQLSGSSTETLIRRKGKVLLQHTESKVRMNTPG